MPGLQINPTQLHFCAAAGADAPVTLTLFNPHPVERVAFKIKTTASSTYRVWPNSGALEAGETARVQVLLLGTKVDLADPLRVDECRRDRFQVQFMPLAEGQAFDNGLFKLYAGLVRDIKMAVSVDIVDSLPPANGGQAEETSPWEGMVRIALMRMMADEEREAAANAACLTKFSELLVLNSIISTEQMWACFNLVGDMYQTSGEGQKVMSKVEQWLEHPDFLNMGDPDAALERRKGSDTSGDSFSERSGEPGELHTPHEREEATPHSRREGEGEGEESYPASPFSQRTGDDAAAGDAAAWPAEQYAFAPLATGEPASGAAAGAGNFADAQEQPTLTAPESAQGFGSAHSAAAARSGSVSDAEDVSIGESDDQLEEVAQLASAASGDAIGADGEEFSESEDSLAAEMAAARVLAAGEANGGAVDVAGSGADGAAGREQQQQQSQPATGSAKTVNPSFAAAREAAVLAPTAEQRANARTVTPVRVTLQERKAALAKALPHVPDPMLQAAMADELDEAFAPDMLAEARAQMAAAGTAMAQTSVVPPTGPHMLSFADRAAMYGAISSGRGSASGRGGSGPPGNGRAGGSFSEQSSGALPRPPGDLPPFPGAGAPGSGPDSLHRRSDSDRARAMRRSASAGAAAAGFARPSGDTAGYSRPSGDETGAYARESGREYGSALARDSGREAGIVRNSARDSTFTRESGYSRETMWEAGLARGSGQMSAFTRASAQEVQYTRESDGYARQSGTESSFARRSSGEMRNSAQPSSDTRPPPRPGIAGQSPRAANHSPRFVDSALDSGTRGSVSRISGRASGELRRRPSAEEPAAAAASRPGVGAAAGDLRYAAPQLQPGGAPAAPPPPADRQQLLPGGGANGASWRGGGTTSEPPSPAGRDGEQEEELGPAVRVLLPGKQSLTRSELAAATTTLRFSADGGRPQRTASATRLAGARRSASFGAGAGQVAPDSEAASTAAETPVSPAQQRADTFSTTTGGAVPASPRGGGGRSTAAAPPQPRKKGGLFKKLGDAISSRAEAAARNAAGGSGYYYV